MIGNKNITKNIYRLQGNDSIMCEYFCIGFIDFMLKDKNLLDYINLFSPNEQNIKIIFPITQNFFHIYILKKIEGKNLLY